MGYTLEEWMAETWSWKSLNMSDRIMLSAGTWSWKPLNLTGRIMHSSIADA